jgi:hypothetical protein
MTTITLRTTIPPNRQITLNLPENTPVGSVSLEIHISPEAPRVPGGSTLGELTASPLCGIWADRTDIEDNLVYARQLRTQAEQRTHG